MLFPPFLAAFRSLLLAVCENFLLMLVPVPQLGAIAPGSSAFVRAIFFSRVARDESPITVWIEARAKQFRRKGCYFQFDVVLDVCASEGNAPTIDVELIASCRFDYGRTDHRCLSQRTEAACNPACK